MATSSPTAALNAGFFLHFLSAQTFFMDNPGKKKKRLVSKTQALAKLFFSRTIVEEIKQVLGDIIEMEVKVKM